LQPLDISKAFENTRLLGTRNFERWTSAWDLHCTRRTSSTQRKETPLQLRSTHAAFRPKCQEELSPPPRAHPAPIRCSSTTPLSPEIPLHLQSLPSDKLTTTMASCGKRVARPREAGLALPLAKKAKPCSVGTSTVFSAPPCLR